ncbi:MAG TPA: exopolysaccharide biosynthesis polyprenyl glycosylphosphotransferase [Acetobacteraceae bacterium]|nr:exopolysaccharide biosynthesis polyprenyl glycosylphosphotransferase [Acetobacteraceae bacterium]
MVSGPAQLDRSEEVLGARIDVLVHRLPCGQIAPSVEASEPRPYEFAAFAKLPLRACIAGLAGIEVVGAMVVAAALCGLAHGPVSAASLGMVVLAAGAMWLAAAATLGLYNASEIVRGRAVGLPIAAACAIAFGGMTLLALMARGMGGGGWLSVPLWSAGVFLWVAATRVIWTGIVRVSLRRGYTLARALVLGDTASTAAIVGIELERQYGGRLRVAASAAVPGDGDETGLRCIEDAISGDRVDKVFLAESEQTETGASRLLLRLRERFPVDLEIIPIEEVARARMAHFGRDGVLLGNLMNFAALRRVETIAKRAEDLALAVCLLIVFLPLGLMLATLIKLDSPGPVFFVQPRIGLCGRVFLMWKFRTMYHDMADVSSRRQTSRNDSRVTRIGRVLRKTSLDELPQVLNVLRGEMSVVGPRPHALGMTIAGRNLHEICTGYMARYRVKPGITGWAQVNGCRGELNTSQKLRRRVALDCHYVENWSLRTDIMIILRTVTLVAFDHHAY